MLQVLPIPGRNPISSHGNNDLFQVDSGTTVRDDHIGRPSWMSGLKCSTRTSPCVEEGDVVERRSSPKDQRGSDDRPGRSRRTLN